MWLPCMKNDIIIIIIIIVTIIININKVVGIGSSSSACIYMNMYFPTCAQCSKVVRCLRTDVSKQFKNDLASYKEQYNTNFIVNFPWGLFRDKY